MSLARQVATELEVARERFNRSTRHLTDAHSGVTPAPGMMTAAQQVAHVAYTIEWFMERAFGPRGFDAPFEALAEPVRSCTSMTQAKAWFDRSVATAQRLLADKSDEEMLAPLPAGAVMGGAPRIAVVRGMCEHAAHHRGALTVYSRVSGIVPPFAYRDE